MGGAQKKRAQIERQANRGPSGQNVRYDGPSERPGSSAGPGQASSSRGRAPSNAPAQGGPSGPAGSTRTSSRPPSAAGPGPSSQQRSATGPPLRDPALDPSKQKKDTPNRNVEWGGNAWNYYSDDAVREKKTRMRNPFLWTCTAKIWPLH